MDEDPFASPETPPGPPEEIEDAEAIRTALLPREGAVRMAATPFWVVGGIAMVLGGLGLSFGYSSHAVGASLGLLAVGVLLMVLAKAVRDVRTWARAPALVVAALMCAAGVALAVQAGRLEPFHAGLLLLASMPLLLLSSRASGYLFSPDYAAVVRATPHLQYRAPPAVWISLFVLIAAVGAMVWWTLNQGRAFEVRRPSPHGAVVSADDVPRA